MPAFFSLMDSYVDGISTGLAPFTDDIYGILSKFFINSYDDITYGLPNIYFGIAPLVLAIAYFFNVKISLKEKIASGVILAIFFISFLVPKINIIWHMFRAPTWFPVRYTFLFVFFCLMLCCRFIANLKNTRPVIIITGGAVAAMLLILGWMHEGDNMTDNEFLLNMLFVVGLTALMSACVFFRLDRIKTAALGMALVFLALSMGELCVNTTSVLSDLNSQLHYKEQSRYEDYYLDYKDVIDYIAEYDNSEFYRVERDTIRDANDMMTLGANGISHYSSVSNQATNQFFVKLGMHRGYANRYFKYTGAPNYFDSLMGVKYVLSDKGREDYGYELINTINGVGIYENKYALPIAFASGDEIQTVGDYMNSYSPYSNAEKLLCAIADTQTGCYNKVETLEVDGRPYNAPVSSIGVSECVMFTTTVKEDGYYYFYCKNDFSEYPYVYVGDRCVSRWGDVNFDTALSLGYYKKGDIIDITYDEIGRNKAIYSAAFYRLDTAAYDRVFAKIAKGGITLDNEPDSKFSGKITLSKDGYIATSIPFDKGWNVKIDGKKVETECYAGGLLAVKSSAGDHRVEFYFVPRGFLLGATVSIVCILLAAACVYFV